MTGLEAVVAPGELVRLGGSRKDVAGYDLKNLLIGSEGTLGVITAAKLRLIPRPEAVLPVAAFYPDVAAGCAAIEDVLGNGLQPAALEYLDFNTLRIAGGGYPGGPPTGAGFLVLAEADGTETEATALRRDLTAVLEPGALDLSEPDPQELWRWRDGVSLSVTAKRGGKVSEDIVVPLERLVEAIEETAAIGARHNLEACSWGHAGDGNLHSTMLVDPTDDEQLSRAALASGELLDLAVRLGGSISGEHGLGWVRRGELARQWTSRALELHEAVKAAFDPKGLMNPGKKTAR